MDSSGIDWCAKGSMLLHSWDIIDGNEKCSITIFPILNIFIGQSGHGQMLLKERDDRSFSFQIDRRGRVHSLPVLELFFCRGSLFHGRRDRSLRECVRVFRVVVVVCLHFSMRMSKTMMTSSSKFSMILLVPCRESSLPLWESHVLCRSTTISIAIQRRAPCWPHHLHQFFHGGVLSDRKRSEIFVASIFSVDFHFERFVFRSNRFAACLRRVKKSFSTEGEIFEHLPRPLRVDLLLVARFDCERDVAYWMWKDLVRCYESGWSQWFSSRWIAWPSPTGHCRCLASVHADSQVEGISMASPVGTWDDCSPHRRRENGRRPVQWRRAKQRQRVTLRHTQLFHSDWNIATVLRVS